MRATKLFSVSLTLWAVVVGADSASAGNALPIVTPQIKPVLTTPKVGTPVIRPTSSPIKSLGLTTSSINPRELADPRRRVRRHRLDLIVDLTPLEPGDRRANGPMSGPEFPRRAEQT